MRGNPQALAAREAGMRTPLGMGSGALGLKPARESQQVKLNLNQQAGSCCLAQHEKPELWRVVKSKVWCSTALYIRPSRDGARPDPVPKLRCVWQLSQYLVTQRQVPANQENKKTVETSPLCRDRIPKTVGTNSLCRDTAVHPENPEDC